MDSFVFGVDPSIPFIASIVCYAGSLLFWFLRSGIASLKSLISWLKSNKLAVIILIIILLLHFILQLTPIICYRGSNIADSAFYGLASYHIAEGKSRPMYCYGKHFIGSLIPHIIAPMHLMLGKSPIYLRLINTLFYIGFIIILYAITRKLFNIKIALLSALLAAIPPYEIYVYIMYSEYPGILFWGLLSLYLVVRILDIERISFMQYIWYGIILGIGFWVHPQTIYFAGIGSAILFIKDKLFIINPKIIGVPVGFVIGGIVNFVNAYYYNYASLLFFTSIKNPISILTDIPTRIYLFFSFLTCYLGLQNIRGRHLFGEYITILVYVLFIVCVIIFTYKYRNKIGKWFTLNKFDPGPSIYLLYIIVIIIMFSVYDRQRGVFAFKYIWPIWVAVPVFISVACYEIKALSQTASIFVFSIFVVIFSASQMMAIEISIEREGRLAKWEIFCKEQGIKFFYGSWVRTYLNNFVTKEEIIGSSIYPVYEFDPYIPYRGMVENADHPPAFLFNNQQAHRILLLENMLRALGVRYRKSRTTIGTVIHDLSEFVTPRRLLNIQSMPYRSAFTGYTVRVTRRSRRTPSLRMITVSTMNTGEVTWYADGRTGFVEMAVNDVRGSTLRRQQLNRDVEPGEEVSWHILMDVEETIGGLINIEITVNSIMINHDGQTVRIDLENTSSGEIITARNLDVLRAKSIRRNLNMAEYIFFEGWGKVIGSGRNTLRWSGSEESELGFFLKRIRPLRIYAQVIPYQGPGWTGEPQVITVLCNGIELPDLIYLFGPRRIYIELPERYLQVGINRINFRYRYVEPEYMRYRSSLIPNYHRRAIAIRTIRFKRIR